MAGSLPGWREKDGVLSTNGRSLRRVYVVFTRSCAKSETFSSALESVFPLLNHQADLYLILEDPLLEFEDFQATLERAAKLLRKHGILRLQIRPVHPVSAQRVKELKDVYLLISALGKPFHQEALAHQVASRWMLLPILRARSEAEVEAALELIPFLRERMILPSLSLPPSPRLGQWAKRLEPGRSRLLLEEKRSPVENVFSHDLLDEMLSWSLSSEGGFAVEPCRSLILDRKTGLARVCPKDEWRALEGPEDFFCKGQSRERCVECWNELPVLMEDVVRWNGREEEGARIRHQLGVFAMSRGELGEAEAHLKAGLEMSKNAHLRFESLLYLGIMKLQQGSLQQAQELLEEARDLNPESGVCLYHLGRCQFAWKDYIEAAELFQRALEAGVEHGLREDLLLQLAVCHIHLEEFQEAWEALEQTSTSKAPFCFYRGMALLGQGRTKEALEKFREALERGPEPEDLSSVLFYLAHSFKELGFFKEAIPWLEKALEADPRSYEAWNLLGFCRFKLGLYHEAIEAFLKALEINPRSAIDLANIGSNLRELGDNEGAITWYKRALALDPSLGFAAQSLKRLERQSTGRVED